MRDRRRFVRPVAWSAAVLAGGGLLFALLLAANIPYQSVPETPAPSPVRMSAPTEPTTTRPPAPTAQPVEPPGVRATVIAVRTGPDDHSLLVAVTLSGPDCGRDPVAKVISEESDTVSAEIVYTPAPCPKQDPAEIRLSTARPIGDRPVILNGGERWDRLDDHTWAHCGSLGCHPPADHCAPVRVAQTAGEAIDHSAVACDQNWLVTDRVNFPGDHTLRVLYRWGGNAWVGFGNSHSAGCAEILAQEPKFPVPLCERLPAP